MTQQYGQDEPPGEVQSDRVAPAAVSPCLLLEVDDALHGAVPLHHAHGLQRRHIPEAGGTQNKSSRPVPKNDGSAPPAAFI